MGSVDNDFCLFDWISHTDLSLSFQSRKALTNSSVARIGCALRLQVDSGAAAGGGSLGHIIALQVFQVRQFRADKRAP